MQESEKWIGEWMTQRGLRDDIVLATKYTAAYKGVKEGVMPSNYGGNSAKTLHLSVEDSLRKLRTSYIDLVRLQIFPPWCLEP